MKRKLILLSSLCILGCSLTSCSGNGFSAEVTDPAKKETIRTSLSTIKFSSGTASKVNVLAEKENDLYINSTVDLNFTYLMVNYHLSGVLQGVKLLSDDYKIYFDLNDDSGNQIVVGNYSNSTIDLDINEFKVLNVTILNKSSISLNHSFAKIQSVLSEEYLDFMKYLEINDSDDFKVKEKVEEEDVTTYVLSVDLNDFISDITSQTDMLSGINDVYLGPSVSVSDNTLQGFSTIFSYKYSFVDISGYLKVAIDNTVKPTL